MLKFSGDVIWRLGKRITLRKYSGPSATVFKTDKSEVVTNAPTPSVQTSEAKADDSGLVAAAFAALNNPEAEIEPKKPSVKSAKLNKIQQLDKQIITASNVDSLLKVAENSVVSRRHALKMVSVLSDWSSSNKVKISDFEKDPRFLKLCRILARTPTSQALTTMTMADDLGTVLGITGDDEAARLINNLTLSQMVKVLQALQHKGRRSTPLLRALSFNIVKQPETIDLKKSADILFSMAALNFPDPVLLDRICNDIVSSLPDNPDKCAAVASIMRSLGLLRYRHETCVSAVGRWLSRRTDVPPAAIATAVVTLATLNIDDGDIVEIARKLKEEDLPKSSIWLDLVYSLLILDKASVEQLQSTLRPEFIEKLLASGEIPIPARRKLMAIDGYLSLTAPASPRLPEEISSDVPLVYTKEKTMFVQSVMDTFRNLVSADSFVRKECNSGMGFLYDAEFALDSKCHPVPLDKVATNKDARRIAAMCLEYHDMSRRNAAPLGHTALYSRLLTLQGFHVLVIPYTEFNPKDKLVTRVKYIEQKLKNIVAGQA